MGSVGETDFLGTLSAAVPPARWIVGSPGSLCSQSWAHAEIMESGRKCLPTLICKENLFWFVNLFLIHGP
jgi:hypothetical protein